MAIWGYLPKTMEELELKGAFYSMFFFVLMIWELTAAGWGGMMGLVFNLGGSRTVSFGSWSDCSRGVSVISFSLLSGSSSGDEYDILLCRSGCCILTIPEMGYVAF